MQIQILIVKPRLLPCKNKMPETPGKSTRGKSKVNNLFTIHLRVFC